MAEWKIFGNHNGKMTSGQQPGVEPEDCRFVRQIKHFRTGDARFLISSDVTARGIDIQQVSAVINYDLTRNVHTYLHRIGRSGRWGRRGIAINFVTKYDVRDLRSIEDYYKIEIHELPASFNGDV